MKLTNEFDPIRQWAKERGIYDKGDVKTQCLKFQEEVGELARAILKNNDAEFVDAVGDCIVVLTNLVELAKLDGITIESCVNKAFAVIKNRTGKMVNNTFIKDK